jgi:rubrerythrin
VEEVLQMLREDAIGELVAINQYEQHIARLDDGPAAKALQVIAADEREHLAILTRLIDNLDPIQYKKSTEFPQDMTQDDFFARLDALSKRVEAMV